MRASQRRLSSLRPPLNRNEDQLRDSLGAVLGRLHAIVVGPGLGRDEHMQTAGRIAIEVRHPRSRLASPLAILLMPMC